VRIIGGRWKRTPITVLNLPGLRPTPDRVRETLFNWLGQDRTGWTCLDLYAGSGALGLEAASRGAARVVLVEREARAVRALCGLRDKLGAQTLDVVQADAVQWLERCAQRFDLILLDPPFQSDALSRVLPAALRVLAPGGMVYVESAHALNEAQPPLSAAPGLAVHRSGAAGQVHYHLLRDARVDPNHPVSTSVPTTPGA
jgi:16S rRNA (guanine(966)-N(2))-methyltransferase RsmD